MARINDIQPCSPVERILICHPTLPEKCLNGKHLSEDAGIEEISDQIFLYNRSNSSVEDSNAVNDYQKEAVQFMGLCVALYALPSSVRSEIENLDKNTKEVYLGKSTLVFVPLEHEDEILAVIQIRREQGGGNPLAVRKSVERYHSLFCAFHGGGILHQLKQGPKLVDQPICIYPGFDRLYSLRKDLRKQRMKLTRVSSTEADHDNLQQHIDGLSQELSELLKQLPSESIRQDLSSHYNEYLDNLSLVTSRQGGGLRCLVDCVPAPVAQDSGLHTFQSSPSKLSNEVVSKLKTDMQHTLLEGHHHPLLFGLSTFHSGHLIQFDFFGNGRSHFLNGITSETVTAVMGYMVSYRIKLQQNITSQVYGQESNMTSPLRLGRIASSIGYNYQAHHHQSSSSDSEQGTLNKGSFLNPPPSFMLSWSQEYMSIVIDNDQVVWAPLVNLAVNGDNGIQDESKRARVLLYTAGPYSFLIFLHDEELDLDSETGKEKVSSTLVSVRSKLDSAVVMAQSMSPQSPAGPSSFASLEPGVDFMVIDRKKHELILFTDRNTLSNSMTSKNMSSTGNGSSPRKLFGFIPPKMAVPSQEEKKVNSHSVEWSVLGLDCRHLLASHLHLDLLLAFDDMMNDIASKFSEANSSSESRYVELCTCMALGWVYGCANEGAEMYAFFDNSVYVTVSDVQNAVKRIKERVSMVD